MAGRGSSGTEAIGVAEDAGKLAELQPDEAAMIGMPQPYSAVLSA